MNIKPIDERGYIGTVNTNSIDTFIAMFNKLEKWAKKEAGLHEDDSLKKAFSILRDKKKNAVVKRYYDELELLRKIRNLLVHEKTDPENHVIYPSEEIVASLHEIYQKLAAPKKVGNVFNRSVVTFTTEDSLASVLKVIEKQSYTNFPIYLPDGKFVGVLTDNGVARWLAENVEDGDLLVSTVETKVKDVIDREEIKNNYIFINKNTSVYDAKDMFQSHKVRLAAILITENGKEHEKLLGIITAYDILEIHD